MEGLISGSLWPVFAARLWPFAINCGFAGFANSLFSLHEIFLIGWFSLGIKAWWTLAVPEYGVLSMRYDVANCPQRPCFG